MTDTNTDAGSLDYRLLRRIAKQFMKTGLMDRGNTAEELTDSVLDDMLDEVLRVNRKDAERGYIAV